MNKYQEALNRIKKFKYRINSWEYSLGEKVRKETDLLQELVDKAAPEKPTFNGYVYFCGKCHGSVWQIRPESNYCFRCGQKLDWSKDE